MKDQYYNDYYSRFNCEYQKKRSLGPTLILSGVITIMSLIASYV